jgi:aldehyde:ferredoxin oxidoreductase
VYGYTGRLLFVDLSTGETDVRALDETTAKNFIGGPSLGAKILYDEMPANTDVFSKDSMVGFVTGPANGSGALMGGRYTVVSKSPVTGGWNDANSGGHFGPQLRQAGYDAVFVKGISEKPVYIFIDDGKVELRDAAHLWGKVTSETERTIKEELGDARVGIALIGPAGETLQHGGRHERLPPCRSQGGTGAVLGSKKLKALVVRGKHKIEVKDRDAIVRMNKEVLEYGNNGPVQWFYHLLEKHGTGGLYESSIMNGDTSIRNWAGNITELTEEQIKRNTTQYTDTIYSRKKYACNACPMGCGSLYTIELGQMAAEGYLPARI